MAVEVNNIFQNSNENEKKERINQAFIYIINQKNK